MADSNEIFTVLCLPEEILAHIFHFLDWYDKQSAKAVSKLWLRIIRQNTKLASSLHCNLSEELVRRLNTNANFDINTELARCWPCMTSLSLSGKHSLVNLRQFQRLKELELPIWQKSIAGEFGISIRLQRCKYDLTSINESFDYVKANK